MRTGKSKLMAAVAVYGVVLLSTLTSPKAQCGPSANGTFINGSCSGPSELGPTLRGAFLFEPEFPPGSLKTVPIWNELEQLLDDPYLEALCSNLPASQVPFPIGGTTQIIGGGGSPSPVAVVYPAYCSAFVAQGAASGLVAGPNGVVRGRPSFGVSLPPLFLHSRNYNPTNGEEMRLLNPYFPGAAWQVPDQLVQCSTPEGASIPGCAGTVTAPKFTSSGAIVPVVTGPFNPNRWLWTYRPAQISPGAGRVLQAEIDYNAPANPDDRSTCLVTTEVVPPEGATICGGDPGEPNYFGFGVNNANGYSTPAVPGGTLVSGTTISGVAASVLGMPLFDPLRGTIAPRDASGGGGLRKPSLRIPPYGTPAAPGFGVNTDPDNVAPSNENDYVRNRQVAAALGKSLFWDMQVGSDAVQACGSCHAHAGADNRTKNQMNPNDIGGDVFFEVGQSGKTLFGANHDLVAGDFPIHNVGNPNVAGDPKCTSPIFANVNATGASGLPILENTPRGVRNQTVCDAGNIVKTSNDVASSMGVHFGKFLDIPIPGSAAFGPASNGVMSVLPDLRMVNGTLNADGTVQSNVDPIPGFAGIDGSGNQFRRVEPRNTPTIFAAALNFDNFWDGRAKHDFNGGSVFGATDPQRHVFVTTVANTTGSTPNGHGLTATRQIIRFVSIASLATGPALSQFEMAFSGRNWQKIGKKLLQGSGTASLPTVTPLANQLVATDDSVMGQFSNQGGSACASLPAADRSGSPLTTTAAGKPGLCISYPALIRRAFHPALWANITTNHLNGCYTDGRTPADRRTPPCPAGTLDDPFDHYVLSIGPGSANPLNTNQFTQMEANMSLFFGLSIHVWATLLMPDNTPADQFEDANPDAFESFGEVGEPGLVGPLPVCTSATQQHCFREIGNFKRDSSFADRNTNNCLFPHSGEGVITQTLVSVAPCKGTRAPGSNAPDPLLGFDIFGGSNLSLKNPNFRAARCGECHAGATLTDNTMPFTFKAQLGDFIGEFLSPGNEALIEPLGRARVITGFLLESEFNENGQDAIERRIINQSISPCPTNGLAFPGGLDPAVPVPGYTGGVGFGLCNGAASSLFDNGVYNIGVTPCDADQTHPIGQCDDIGRGATDAFGWPMSLAALLLKNLGGNGGSPCITNPTNVIGGESQACNTEPGSPLLTFDPNRGGGGGLFEETAQDQQLNPGEGDDPVNPLLPPYLAPFASNVPVGDAMPELDEIHVGLNTLTDIAITEGFIDVLGPFNPAGVLNESMNNGEGPEMGTWPVPNRVGRMGSIKAPQLREVELTGPYFHNGGKLTLRQVIDFYVRGGDFPVTNAEHRDFNIINLNVEAQSNLSEHEKVALVDYLLEFTDDRVRFERGPFDHPQVILPLDGTAPEPSATFNRDNMLASCVPADQFGPGQRACVDSANGKLFLDVPAVGTTGNTGPLPNFLNISSDPPGGNRSPGKCSTSHYCQ